MTSKELQDVIKQVDQLTPDEQLQLLVHLVENVRQARQAEPPQLTWRDIRGALPYGLYGEDAQVTISRERREDDEHRAAVLKRGAS